MTEYCKKMVRGEGSWGSIHRRQCGMKAKKDDYCGIHHPETVKRRREKIDARNTEASERRKAIYIREAFDRRAGDRCRELGIEPEDIKA